MSDARVDLLVVGLGPGGGAAAAAAARRGLKVLAIDRKREIGVPVQCAEYIPLPLARYATRDGISVQAIASMLTTLPSASTQSSAFSGLMIDRAHFDCALAEQARAARAELRLETRLASLHAAQSAATLVTRGAVSTVQYRAMIAADGPGSAVARALGLPALAVIHTRQYTVPLSVRADTTDIYLSAAYPGGYAWLFPKRATANLGLGFDQRFGGDFKRSLDDLHARLAAGGEVGSNILSKTGGAIPVGGLRSKLVVGNIAFVGDAGGFTHPITGAGIAAAVVSGECAGEAAARLIASGEGQALHAYEAEMREQFEESLERAVARRNELLCGWNVQAQLGDALHRRGWIAFPEYYA